MKKVIKMALSTEVSPKSKSKVLEYHLQQSFFAVLEYIKMKTPGDRCWRRTSETSVKRIQTDPAINKMIENLKKSRAKDKPIKKNGRADFVIYNTNDEYSTYIIEFKRMDTDNPTIDNIRHTLMETINQSKEYAGNFYNPNTMAFIWSRLGILVCSAGPFKLKETDDKIKEINSKSLSDIPGVYLHDV